MSWLGHKCHKSLSPVQECWLSEIVACSFQELHGGEPGERSHGSAEDELPRNEAVLPTQISECPVGSHRGEHCLCPLERGLVRGDTNEEKGPVKLVKPRVCETKGISNEQ